VKTKNLLYPRGENKNPSIGQNMLKKSKGVENYKARKNPDRSYSKKYPRGCGTLTLNRGGGGGGVRLLNGMAQ
jgi:hypothetical protein